MKSGWKKEDERKQALGKRWNNALRQRQMERWTDARHRGGKGGGKLENIPVKRSIWPSHSCITQFSGYVLWLVMSY